MKTKKVPMRKCVGCGISKPQKELVRIACDDGKAVVDRAGSVDGRGVYLCPDAECIRKAKKKHVIQRSFGISADDEDLERLFEEVLVNGRS